MPRLPFNPDNVATPDTGGPARRERQRYGSFDRAAPLSVSSACRIIKRVLADRMPSPVRIVGEVSNFSDRRHWFLSLKDEKNVLPCVMWASAARGCAFTPERGQQVVATGRIDFYGPQSRLQLYIDELEPVGQGALELQYRRLCEELRGLGYFAEERKKPLPLYPRHIAVVTSGSGAALHDVARTARQRWPSIALTLVDVRVQGAAAAPEIVRAIEALGRHRERLELEAMILTRGGGSLEDLWAFNERAVADALLRCPLPTVAAIGHETDLTIAELVADLRCSTPTQAAARLVPDSAAETQRIDQLASRLALALRRLSEQARARLDGLALHPMFRRPAEPIIRRRDQLGHQQQRMHAAMRQETAALRDRLGVQRDRLSRFEPHGRLRLARHQLETAARRLNDAMRQHARHRRMTLDAMNRQLSAIGPESVLRRGYSYTTTPRGRLIQSAEQVRPGDPLVTHLIDGEVRSTATPDNEDDKPRPPAKPAPRRRPKRPLASRTPGLFDSK